jgi:hypothetical protein
LHPSFISFCHPFKSSWGPSSDSRVDPGEHWGGSGNTIKHLAEKPEIWDNPSVEAEVCGVLAKHPENA